MSTGDNRRHKRLHRLDQVWIPYPVYFITTCTFNRRTCLLAEGAPENLHSEWAAALSRHGWRIGRYMIMPDHAHFFCQARAEGAHHGLSAFLGAWKQWTAKAICARAGLAPPLWQEGFFDHVLRSAESYAQKWAYVRENPVRRKYVAQSDDWPHQGFVDFDRPQGW